MRLDDVVNVNKRNCGSRDHKPNTDVAPKHILSLHLPSGTIVELYILEFAFHAFRDSKFTAFLWPSHLPGTSA